MQRKWTGKNVDLAEFTTRMGVFFKEKDFEAIKGETKNGYQIFATDSPYFRIDGYVSVIIEGKPGDFVVKLEFGGEDTRRPFLPTFLTTMFGGGYFLSRRLKSQEALMKFEKEFWRFVENVVLHLTDSNTSSNGGCAES